MKDLESLATYPENSNSLTQLNLYPNLSLYPRWPGLEEDDDLAGPAVDSAQPGTGTSTPIIDDGNKDNSTSSSKGKKEYTKAEYETMNLKTLGRLKAQGYEVDSYMRIKRRETKDRRLEAKRRRVDAGLPEPSREEEEEEEQLAEGDGEVVEVDEEEGVNA